MHKKIISIIAALLLMISTFVPFTKVLAQGLVEYAIILWAGVVAFNKNTESVELIYLPNPPSQAEPQRLIDPPTYYYVVRNHLSDPTCTQTIQAPVKTTPGLNVMTLAINGAAKLVVNGKEVGDELDHECFDKTDRIIIEVGVPVPPGSDLTVLPAIPPHLKFLTVTVVDKAGGGTKATSSWVGEGAHAFIEEVTP